MTNCSNICNWRRGANEFIMRWVYLDVVCAAKNGHDLVTVFWRRMPGIAQPDFNWTELGRVTCRIFRRTFGAAFHDYTGRRGTAGIGVEFQAGTQIDPA